MTYPRCGLGEGKRWRKRFAEKEADALAFTSSKLLADDDRRAKMSLNSFGLHDSEVVSYCDSGKSGELEPADVVVEGRCRIARPPGMCVEIETNPGQV